jgi:hypothetical protein
MTGYPKAVALKISGVIFNVSGNENFQAEVGTERPHLINNRQIKTVNTGVKYAR